jgi:hypothetical protein
VNGGARLTRRPALGYRVAMKTALALALIVACPSFASDPSGDRRFEFVESTLAQTLSGMKRLRYGMGKAEVERLLPIRSMKSEEVPGQIPDRYILCEFNKGRYKMYLRFQGDDGLRGAHLWKIDESGTHGVAHFGE